MFSSHDALDEISCVDHDMEPPIAKRRRRVSQRQHKNTIFLSHSGQEKAFVEQLYKDLKRANHRLFFDQESDCLPKAEKFAGEILQAAEQCRLGVVVLSESYLTSKWPMLELSKFVESKKTKNSDLKLFPLFYKLLPSDLIETAVERKWKHIWRELVEKGEVKEEELVMWSEALKELRSTNGLEYWKFANSEYKYRSAVVEEICKLLPPILEWSINHIQGFERLCEMTSSMFNKIGGRQYLGLYGMGGVGKTTLCVAMCSYFQDQYCGRVLLVELESYLLKDRRLARLKRALRQLTDFDKYVSNRIASEEQGWECLKNGLRNQPPVFLAIDNVGDAERSREEARSYLNVGLAFGSKVLVTSRSREILESVLGQAEYCKPIPRLERHEAAKLFLSVAAPNIPSMSLLKPEESEIVERCLSECQFADNGYPSKQYHPLILRALGTYFHDMDRQNVMSWEEALENKNKLQRCREAKHVNDILGLNYYSMPEELKLVFLDLAFYPPRMNWGRPWWTKSRTWSDFDLWVSWLSRVHAVSLSDAKMMVKELQRLSLLEGSGSEVSMHDLYKEFARFLVHKDGSKEWQWWMSREEMDLGGVPRLKRLVLDGDESLIGRPPRKLHEWRSLVILKLWCCDDIGSDLELGGFKSLRVLDLEHCENVKRIVCSCGDGTDDSPMCYKKKGGWGCMVELRVVKLSNLRLVEIKSLLRHSSNLQSLRIFNCEKLIGYSTTDANPENDGAIDLQHLRDLRILSVIGCNISGVDVRALIKWLTTALQLENLTALEYLWRQYREQRGAVGGYTIDLHKLSDLSSTLSVLSLRLPEAIREVKGLHLLSELTTLNLNHCRGLRQLVDLQRLPKLKWICVYGCCNLDIPPCLGSAIRQIQEFSGGHALDGHDFYENYGDQNGHQCLQPYCNSMMEDCHICTDRAQGRCINYKDVNREILKP